MYRFIIFTLVVNLICMRISSATMSNISPTASIDPTVFIGDFANIGDAVVLENNVYVGSFATVQAAAKILNNVFLGQFSNVGRNAVIGEKSHIGEYVQIHDRANLKENVTVHEYANIGHDSQILQHSNIGAYAVLNGNDLVEEKVFINEYAGIGQNTTIKKNAIVNKYASTHRNVVVNEKAYVGNYVIISQNGKIGTGAVLHQYSTIHDNEAVPENGVVVPAQTSQNLFNIARKSSCNMREIESKAEGTDAEFNEEVKSQIERIFTKISDQCPVGDESVESRAVQTDDFSCLTTLYLVKFYGKERFHELNENQNRNQNELQNEIHFGKRPSKSILSAENQNEYIKCLAIYEDLRRDLRVQDDYLCNMIDKIKNNKVAVRTSDPKYPN